MSDRFNTVNTRPTIGLLFSIGTGNPNEIKQTIPQITGVYTAAKALGANLICLNAAPVKTAVAFHEQANILYDLVSAKNVDGLLIWSGLLNWYISAEEMARFCQKFAPLPMVSIETIVEGIPSLTMDDYQGVRSSMKHLVEDHGYQRIAFLRGPEHHPGAQMRYRGYMDGLTECGITVDPMLVSPTSATWNGASALTSLEQRGVTFDAMVAANDNMAMGAMKLLKEQGKRIPEDVAVVGFQNVDETAVQSPPITTVFSPYYEVGKRSMEMLLEQIAGRSIPDQVTLPTQLLIRQSCGCQSRALENAGAPISLNTEPAPRRAAGRKQAQTEYPVQARDAFIQNTRAACQEAGLSTDLDSEGLWNSFWEEINGQPGNQVEGFLPMLQQQILTYKARNGMLWQDLLSSLRSLLLPVLSGQSAEFARAENLLQKARVLAAELSMRALGHRQFEVEGRSQQLNSVAQSLINTFETSALFDVIARRLPELGITRGFISLFENREAPQSTARLMLAFDENGRMQLPEGGLAYPTDNLLPPGLYSQEEQDSLIFKTLYFREELIGIAAFDMQPEEIATYEILRGEISSALMGALLVNKVEERANQMDVAAKVSSSISSILDPDVLIQQTVELVRERFGLYYVGLFLTDEGSQYAVLRAGTGEPGRQMLENQHRLALNETSMVSWCIANRKARVASNAGVDAVRFNNPFLPETRSELALPLISRGQAIGALSIQSAQASAFREEEITVLQTMTDQLANGIENARLYNQAQQRTEELSKARELAEHARDAAEKAARVAEQERERAELARLEAEKARREAEAEKEKAEAASRSLAAQMWQTNGIALLNERMRGEQDVTTLANNVIRQLCEYLSARVGLLYLKDNNKVSFAGSYAYRHKNHIEVFEVGEGSIGQAALGGSPVIVKVPDEMIVHSPHHLDEVSIRYFVLSPFSYNGQVVGVVEIGLLTEITTAQTEFLERALESMAVAFMTAQARRRVNELYSETRQQAEELQAQEEELRATNEELETQAETLRASEAKLRMANVELEDKAAALQKSSEILKEKQDILDHQNQVLRDAQQDLEQKAADLAQASKYKSEFLANMSHELRTPLNSLLILASMLAKNEEGNLNQDQVESAQIIYNGGTDLLSLINEILDLSKVEAGKMQFRFAPMPLESLAAAMRTQFSHVAEERGLEFAIHMADDLPESIETDQQRLEQIIKNLLSNAFKFTSAGSVRLEVVRPRRDEDRNASGMDLAQTVAIRVKDTGIGMTPEQQKIVFEAFQQADGTTSRQYGGTGLGLTISRELATHLGGQIQLQSEIGKGSAFTIYLPIAQAKEQRGASRTAPTSMTVPQPYIPSTRPHPPVVEIAPSNAAQAVATDDRDVIQPADRVLLVIEDDPTYAQVLQSFAHQKKFKCLMAESGESGVKLAQSRKVDAIILDLGLPGMSGWEVLDVLKSDSNTRHIPVHIISAANEDPEAFQRGAMGFLSKPTSPEDIDQIFQHIEQYINKKIKKLLLIEDDDGLRKSVHKLLESNDIEISETGEGQAALDLLAAQHFDCMILDLTLPDMSGFDLLNRLNGGDEKLHSCPIIIYTGKDLSEDELTELNKYADSVIVKGVKSPERLLDETALFLHQVISSLPEEKQQTIKQLHDPEAILTGKHILIVDDDARNAFALSKLLSSRGLVAMIAPSGPKAFEIMEEKTVQLALVDIMMPGMDGYEVIRHIRADARFRGLPILALTAKAMKGDREKCIEAGANDYLSKPIDVERLFSMLRVWLSK